MRNFVQQEGIQWSGAVAFFLVLSIPPLLIAAFSIGIVIVGPDTARSYITDQVAQFLPARQDVIRNVVSQTIQGRGAAVVVSLAFLLFSGSRVFAALVTVINVMWRELPDTGFWRKQLTRLIMLVTVGGLFALAGAVDLVIAISGDAIPDPLRVALQTQVLPALLATAALFLLFKFTPRNAATWRTALAGALVGMLMLRIAQAGFTAYLRSVGGFQSAYGPLAGAAILMTWALVASGAILLAAHLVAVLNDADPGGAKPRAARSGDTASESG